MPSPPRRSTRSFALPHHHAVARRPGQVQRSSGHCEDWQWI
uniref:Uncharacterized protein n=1 Tax=Cyprinus carpio TaxID=7962 RepID=A0A8C2JWT5_CYPCA